MNNKPGIFKTLKHRFFGSGSHPITGTKVTVTKYRSVDKHKNMFRTKQYVQNWCPYCKVSFGIPEHNHSQTGLLVEIKQEHYLSMTTNGYNTMMCEEVSTGEQKISFW